MENNNLVDLKKIQSKKKDESIEVEKYLAELKQLRKENQEKARQETVSLVKQNEKREEKNAFYDNPADLAVSTFWLKLAKRSMYLLIFLLPLFFLPITIYPVDANKQLLVVILVSVSLFCYLANCYFSRKIIYSRSLLVLAAVFFVIAGGLSAFFSISPSNSFYGDFSRADVFINFVIFGLALYLTAVLFKKEDFDKIGLTFVASLVIISILGLLQLFGIYIFPFDFAKQAGFNVFGSVINFDIFISFGLVLIVAALVELKSSIKVKVTLIISALLIMLNLILINYQPIWALLAIIMVIYAIYKLTFKSEGSSTALVGSSLPLLIGIVAFLFAMVSPSLPKIMNLPNIPIDIKPNFSTTLNVSREALTGFRILTGTGLSTFSSEYNLYRPVELNQSDFWRIKFDQGFSFAGTFLTTAGIVGILSIFFLIFAFGRLAIRNMEDKKAMVVTIGMFFMIMGWFYFPASFVGLMFSFMALGLLAVFDSDPKEFDFSREPKSRAIISLALVIIFAAGAMSLIYLSSKKYAAAFYFQNGLKEYNSGNTAKSAENMLKAISLDQENDQYLRSASQLMIIDAQKSRDANTELSKDVKFQGKIADSIKLAKAATEINPADAENWYNLGDVYETIINIADMADSFAESSYRNSAERNPKNPDPLIGQAKALMFTARKTKDNQIKEESMKKAIDVLEKAVELKSDYATSHFQLGLAYVQANRKNEAINEFELTKTLSDSDAPVNFQLGMLYYNNEDLDKARIEMEAAIELDPNFSNARYVLGLIYDKKKDKDNAIKQFELVLKLNPNSIEVKDILKNLKSKGSAFASDKPIFSEAINQSLGLPELEKKEGNDPALNSPVAEIPAVPSVEGSIAPPEQLP